MCTTQKHQPAIGLACLRASCGQAKPAKPSTPPQVSVVTAQRGSVPVSVELPGRTSPYLVAEVRARVDGIVADNHPGLIAKLSLPARVGSAGDSDPSFAITAK